MRSATTSFRMATTAATMTNNPLMAGSKKEREYLAKLPKLRGVRVYRNGDHETRNGGYEEGKKH